MVLGATYDCTGVAPDWTLKLTAQEADFAFLDRRSTMQIPQQSGAEGAEWPVAFTLIGSRDSAILILDQTRCGAFDFEALVLTQRGETPILLKGCCEQID